MTLIWLYSSAIEDQTNILHFCSWKVLQLPVLLILLFLPHTHTLWVMIFFLRPPSNFKKYMVVSLKRQGCVSSKNADPSGNALSVLTRAASHWEKVFLQTHFLLLAQSYLAVEGRMWSWWCHSDITSSQAADISPSVWLCLGFSPSLLSLWSSLNWRRRKLFILSLL